MDSLEIVIPAYNEEENIAKVIDSIHKNLGNYNYSVLVIDDASEDKTQERALSYGVKVIRHPYRLGNGAAIKTGLKNSGADIVVLMDGDGQHLPEDIPLLLKHIDNVDMVVGARDFRGFSIRNLGNRIYNLFASYITQFKIQDLTCGFRVIKRKTALRFLYLLPNGFSYPTTLTLSILRSGRTIRYIPIPQSHRKGGKSKISIIKDGVKFFMIIMRIATFFSPLRFFLPVSVFFFICGFLYYLYTFFAFHRFTNMSALLFSTAVIIFMLGLVSEQIAQLRMDRTED